jgi:hypothetical protein
MIVKAVLESTIRLVRLRSPSSEPKSNKAGALFLKGKTRAGGLAHLERARARPPYITVLPDLFRLTAPTLLAHLFGGRMTK